MEETSQPTKQPTPPVPPATPPPALPAPTPPVSFSVPPLKPWHMAVGFAVFLIAFLGGGTAFIYFQNASSPRELNSQQVRSHYSIKSDGVYFLDSLVKGADPQTFAVLSSEFAKDKQYAYFADEVIPGADAATFTIISTKTILADPGGVSDLYTKDQNRVYFSSPEGGSWPLPDADPSTFVVLGQIGHGSAEDSYAKDRNHVWFDTNLLADADIPTFTIDFDSGDYNAQDKKHKYLNGQIVATTSAPSSIPTNLDNASGGKEMITINSGHLYLFGNILKVDTSGPLFGQEPDAATFKAIGSIGSYFKDDRSVYYLNWQEFAEVTGADLNTFMPVYDTDGNEVSIFGRDNKNAFFRSVVIQGADVVTFKAVLGHTDYNAQDKNHKYLNQEVVQ